MTIRSLHLPLRLPLALAAAALPLALQSPARAVNCEALPNPVYVAGSTAVQPFLAKVAGELAGLTPAITVVYQGQGSCTGVGYMSTATTGTISGTGLLYWDTTSTAVTGGCDISALNGEPVDIGVSDVYALSCAGITSMPTDVHDFYGPVQSMTFAVPQASNQNSISAQAAYLVFGLGSAGQASPWTDETLLEIRSATSGTQTMIAFAIKVPAAQWKGVTHQTSGGVLTDLVAAATGGNANAAIGILSTGFMDQQRGTLKELAYQHYEQDCGYWPDSDTTKFDKQNVRDGHYAIWGPLHMLARVSNGTAVNANAQKILDYLTGAVTPTTFDLIQTEAKGGVVPDCAMRVSRTAEIGAMASYMPAKSCWCKYTFEANGTAPAGCQTCTADAGCPTTAPKCNYGYCEVQ